MRSRLRWTEREVEGRTGWRSCRRICIPCCPPWHSLPSFSPPPSTTPAWDAWVSVVAWAGTWLLARRKIENWVVLNVSNLFAIPLLIYKGLPMLAVLTIILFIVAVAGFFDWRRRYKLQTP